MFVEKAATPGGLVLDPCGKCSGHGRIIGYSHIEGGVCFDCRGSGGAWLTPTELEARERDRERRAEQRRKRAEREAKRMDREFQEWKDAHPDLFAALEPYTEEGGFLGELAERVHLTPGRALTEPQTDAAWPAIERARQRDEARQEREARQAAAGHYGEVGKRFEATVTVKLVRDFENAYGVSYLVIMETDEGHALKTFSSGAFGRAAAGFDPSVIRGGEEVTPRTGHRVTIRATVKEHGEYNGQPETMLTRVNVREWHGEGE